MSRNKPLFHGFKYHNFSLNVLKKYTVRIVFQCFTQVLKYEETSHLEANIGIYKKNKKNRNFRRYFGNILPFVSYDYANYADH